MNHLDLPAPPSPTASEAEHLLFAEKVVMAMAPTIHFLETPGLALTMIWPYSDDGESTGNAQVFYCSSCAVLHRNCILGDQRYTYSDEEELDGWEAV